MLATQNGPPSSLLKYIREKEKQNDFQCTVTFREGHQKSDTTGPNLGARPKIRTPYIVHFSPSTHVL